MGSERLRVVCVSGLGGVPAEWERVTLALARRGELVVVERPGSASRSARGSDGPVRAGRAMIGRVLAGESSPAILIGHSMGAVVAMLAAANAPDRVIGLVLTSPFVPVGRYGRSAIVTAADYARHRLLFVAAMRRRPPPGRPSGMNRRERAAGLRSLARYGLRPGSFHALAAQVRCPVLLVHGNRDHYVPAVFALAAVDRHPAWQFRMLDNAGHFPHRDNPVAWLAAVEPWLDHQAAIPA